MFLSTVIAPCTSAGCFLSQKGGLVSFPLVTLAGLIDGVNPCAIGMLVLLLGYLIVFAKKENQVFKIGLIYIATVYLTYLAVGLIFYKSALQLSQPQFSLWFRKIIGGIVLFAGLINLKDFWLLNFGRSENRDTKGIIAKLLDFHLEVPSIASQTLRKYVEKTSIPATIILGILVTLFETPCSLPIYVGTATILVQSGLSPAVIMGYFLYYNLLFVLPLLIIWFLVWRGKRIVEIKEWEHKAKKWMKLSLGILLVLMGGWMIK